MPQIIVIILACITGFLLTKIGMILPWLFGPMIAAIITAKYSKTNIKWPTWLGNLGLFILGAQIGVSFTKEIIADIQNDLWNIILMNVFVIILAVLLSIVFRKIVDTTFETALLSSIPGALSQMIVMAEENKHANLMIVTLSQTSRLLFVVMIVPIISTFYPHESVAISSQRPASLFQVLHPLELLSLIIAIVMLYLVYQRIHAPAPQLLAPITIIIIWNMMTDHPFSIPYAMIAVAQILFGVKIGIQLYQLSSKLSVRLFIGIAVQNGLLIAGTLLLSVLFSLWTSHSFNDLFLSAAPGGMAQIIVVGIETGANVAMISSYHIFRIFFILLFIAPLISYTLSIRTRLTTKKN